MKIGHRSVCYPAITSLVPWGFDFGLTGLPDSFDGPIESVLDQLIPVVLLLPEPLHLTAKVVEFLVLEPDLKPPLTLLQTLIDQFLDVVGLLELLMGVGGARFVNHVLRACADRLATFHYLSVLRTIKWAPHHSLIHSLPAYPRSLLVLREPRPQEHSLLTSYQLATRHHLHLATDVDPYLVSISARPQVQERGAVDLITLLYPRVYGVGSQVAVFEQVSGQATCGAAGRRIFGDTEVVCEHAGREVAWTVVVRFRAEDVQDLSWVGHLCVAFPIDLAAPQGVQVSQRNDKCRKSGGYFLHGRAIVEVRRFEIQSSGEQGRVEDRSEGGWELAHPENLAEGHGDLTGLQLQGDTLDWTGEYLVLDHVRRTEGGMAGEGHLIRRGEDADVVATFGLLLRQNEGRLRVVQLQGNLLKSLIWQAGAATNDGELVARVFLFGEDVHDVEPHDIDSSPGYSGAGTTTE